MGVNNGVMMWRIDRIRERLGEYWGEIMRIVRERAYLAPRFERFHGGLPEGVRKQ